MVFARRRFGQNFLHDPQVIARLIAAIDPRPDDVLLEIGPGNGALTRPLVARAGMLHLIEIDRDLAAALAADAELAPAVTLHVADALEFDYPALAREHGRPLRVIGNLPYNISTPLLFRLLGARAAIADLHVMLQKEVVDRIVARPGTEAYGRLGVMLAPWMRAEPLFDVGPGAFRPAPKVWSSVLRLVPLPKPAFAVDERYARVVAAAFSARRKTLRNALRGLLEVSDISACGIDPGLRPERLEPAQFATLAQRVSMAKL